MKSVFAALLHSPGKPRRDWLCAAFRVVWGGVFLGPKI
jgi:hypothetical protein